MSDAPKDRDALKAIISEVVYNTTEGSGDTDVIAEQILTALESSGCFIAPVVATEEMLEGVTAADQAEPFSDKTMAGIWTAMQSANPYRAPMKQEEMT